MKPINILSLLQAKSSSDKENFASYIKHYGIDIRDAEIEDLRRLADTIKSVGGKPGSFEPFYVGYKIPQIGKEFDLLRLGKDSVLNIEVKSDCTVERAKSQLLRNSYYLRFLGRKLFAFSFVSHSNALYALTDGGDLEKVNPVYLLEIIAKQTPDSAAAPDSLFNPSDYLEPISKLLSA